MTAMQRYGSHFFSHNGNSNVLFLGFSRINKLDKCGGIAVNVNDEITLCRTNNLTVSSNSADGHTPKQISALERNPFERVVNILGDAVIEVNKKKQSSSKEEKWKAQGSSITFNYEDFPSLWQKRTNYLSLYSKKIFGFGYRVIDCKNYSTIGKLTRNSFGVADNFRTESSTTNSIEEQKNDENKQANEYATRSHTCGELCIADLNKEVKLCGWVEFVRMDKFILLRDAYGTTQVLTNKLADHELNLANLHIESVICVTGIVVARPKSQINAKLPTGEIEVEATSVQILNRSLPKMPFLIRDYNKANSKILNRYRFLALRFPELQNNLRLRSKMLFQMRNFLIAQRNFVEVETPTLFKKTPGGAQEFIVPTQFKDRFYSLVQSPQQLKQLLMVGSIDRYFQIARCYRDEKTNPERQPEFTQLDIELSFTSVENIMKLTEEILIASWPSSKPPISAPFPKITYEEAIEKYGSDKPCLLGELLIQNLKNCVRKNSKQFVYMFSVPKAENSYKRLRQRIDKLESIESTKIYVIKVASIEKMLQDLQKIFPDFESEILENSISVNIGDVIVLSIGSDRENLVKALGCCRREVINYLNLLKNADGENVYNFTWIVDFPLFEKNEFGELKSTHHPFTHPHPEDKLLFTDNEAIKARSLAYDLVLNGSEIGGGSIRIHDAELQKTIFKILNLEEKDFSHLLEALEMGCPPHGGIALGLDRLFSIICGSESIKDVIAFPKGWEGQDLMTGCPSDVPISDKKRYHILS
ncbi:aspartate--tRNA ligase, mitochondrial isoform X2 [Planococcus citri]|uniref:aspartate--tRNA ligase, mitochondrial isoform X2 n=1 Tax=Planococcus citri TaxID=170843 RepID=UPI0031F82397